MDSADDGGHSQTDVDKPPEESQVECMKTKSARSKATVRSSRRSRGESSKNSQKGAHIKSWARNVLKMDTNTVGLTDMMSSRTSTLSSLMTSTASEANEEGESRLRRIIRESLTEANASHHRRHHHIDPNALELSILVQVGLEDAAQIASCKALPWLLFIWSLFMVFTNSVSQVTRVHIGERPIRDLVKKGATLSRHDEIVPWLQNVYLPYFWTQSQRADNRTGPRDLIAGVELTLSQAVQMPCRDSAAAHLTCFSGSALNSTQLLTLPPRQGEWYRHHVGRRMQGGPAYATTEPDDSKTNRSLDEHHLRMLKLLFPKYVDFPTTIAFKFHTATSGLALGSMTIPSDASLAWAQSSLTALSRDAHAIHPSTLWVVVRSLTHNLQDPGLVTLFELQFHLHRGGGVFTEGVVLTVDTEPIEQSAQVLGIIWACSLAASSVFHLFLVCHLIRRQKLMKSKANLLVVFTSLVLGWIMLGMFFMVGDSVNNLNGELQAFQQGLANSTKPLQRYQLQEQSARILLSSAQKAGYAAENLMIIAVNYIVLMVGRLLFAISGQPRLAMTLNAIRRASSDIGAIGITSLIALFGFATGGHILLGKRLEPYSTMLGASDACFEIALTRNFPWDKISARNLFTAAIWGYAMIVIMLLFFIMMFLAVVIESYIEVRSTRGLGQTLWQSAQSVKSVYWGRLHNQWWSPMKFVNNLRRMSVHGLTLPQLKEELPEMPEENLNKIFQLAQERKESRRESHMSPGDIIEQLSGIYLGCRELQTKMPVPLGEKPVPSVVEKSSASTDTKPEKPPSEPPHWVNVELMSHFRKQVHLMKQMHSDLSSFKNSLRAQMHAEGLPLSPYTISAPQPPMPRIMSSHCNSGNTDSNSSHWNLPGPPPGTLETPATNCPADVDLEPPVRRIRSQAIGQIFSLGHMPRPFGGPA